MQGGIFFFSFLLRKKEKKREQKEPFWWKLQRTVRKEGNEDTPLFGFYYRLILLL